MGHNKRSWGRIIGQQGVFGAATDIHKTLFCTGSRQNTKKKQNQQCKNRQVRVFYTVKKQLYETSKKTTTKSNNNAKRKREHRRTIIRSLGRRKKETPTTKSRLNRGSDTSKNLQENKQYK